MSPVALARAVLALLTGDVAQRFVARERTLSAEPAFIDDVIRLLSPPGTPGMEIGAIDSRQEAPC